jgi:MYXO-CTERM domain-containing protein
MRSRSRAAFAAVSFLSLLTLVTPGVAAACSCGPLPSPLGAADRAEVIFVASRAPGAPGLSGTTLHVTRVFKGEVPNVVQLESGDCASVADGLGSAPSGEVLIYGSKVPGAVIPSPCSRSAFVADASQDLAFLEASFGAPSHDPSDGPSSAPATSAPVGSAASGPPPLARPARSGGCGCALHAAGSTPTGWLLFLVGLAATRRRRRARSSG